MTLAQALAYFAREACLNLVRSWKVTLLAVLTIATSLFLAGVFILLSGNLRKLVTEWHRESKVVIYLTAASTEEDRLRVEQSIRTAPWIARIESVSAERARERFESTFPSLADLLEGSGGESLPFSFEIAVDWRRVGRQELEQWSGQVRRDPAVSMVDADQDWLGQLETAVLMLRGLGLALGTVLLLTSVFTIASVIRLTAFLYRDEISVMRMVGATEFFIRGPFYVEGLLQGLLGGTIATIGLLGAYRLLLDRYGDSLIVKLVASEFLGVGQTLALIGLGAAAGLVGAVASLRKETLGRTSAPEDWPAA
ncbi:MAG: hypothetical protein HC897_01755 [Thermoanaerobaculia bacterium]|nr:hypothetical protein [Thermoanaerobaculia bacterium]